MPDLGTFVLWGVPLLGIISGVVRFIKWLKPDVSDKVTKLIGGLLAAFGVLGVRGFEVLTELYPVVGEWGPYVLWSFVAFLIYTGNFPDTMQGLKVMAAKAIE